MEKVSDYDVREAARNKEKVEKLERFERAVKGAIDTIDTAIRWLWAIVIIAAPAFLYFKPVPTDGTLQATFTLILVLFLLIVSVIWRALGKAIE